MNKFTAQFYRETWENRGTLVWTPAILLLLITLFVGGSFLVLQHKDVRSLGTPPLHEAPAVPEAPTLDGKDEDSGFNFKIRWDSQKQNTFEGKAEFSPAALYYKQKALSGFQNTLYVTCSSVMILLGFIYAIGSLYNDRRDRSILFFKSLPVSETRVVLTRLTVVAFIMPQLASLCAFVGTLVFFSAASLYCGLFLDLPWMHPWQQVNPFAIYLQSVLAGLMAGIWSLPLMSWLFISSAAAKKMPFGYAVLPWVALAFIVNFIFEKNYVMTFINWYASGFHMGDFFGNIPTAFPPHLAIMEFVNRPALLVMLPLSALMISGAVYLRNRHFEI